MYPAPHGEDLCSRTDCYALEQYWLLRVRLLQQLVDEGFENALAARKLCENTCRRAALITAHARKRAAAPPSASRSAAPPAGSRPARLSMMSLQAQVNIARHSRLSRATDQRAQASRAGREQRVRRGLRGALQRVAHPVRLCSRPRQAHQGTWRVRACLISTAQPLRADPVVWRVCARESQRSLRLASRTRPTRPERRSRRHPSS